MSTKDVKPVSRQPEKQDKKEKGSNAPNKKGHFKVLHPDGSLADLPYNNNPGSGALEGTVGIGQ